MLKSLLFLILLTFSVVIKAQVFPKNIFTAEYYYQFLRSNFAYKLQLLHNLYPHRRLDHFWQYAVGNQCDTYYSHAIIPNIETNSNHITIRFYLTECGQPLLAYQFEFEFYPGQLTAEVLRQIKSNILLFYLPEYNKNAIKKIKATYANALLTWTDTEMKVKYSPEGTLYEVTLTTLEYAKGKTLNHLLEMKFEQFKNSELTFSQYQSINYQPATEDQFPTIYYSDRSGKISAKDFFENYQHVFSKPLNDIILKITDLSEKTFTTKVKPSIN